MNLSFRRKLFEFGPEFLALFGVEQLGVVHPPALRDSPSALEKIPRHDHRRCDHWTRKSSPPHFIDADEAGDSVDLLEVETAQLAAFHAVI